ncbi:WD40-repeat-containing domain protein [Dendryphion nanum]|uniref:WD40-repeat-containing domain protein n=1 Tax=Dendryphion nanum TaxID=256645 RepID=A0A9P9IAV4_9PLEO|nr:WD40-repeat-containing domain protein [Dendryphion nanum]
MNTRPILDSSSGPVALSVSFNNDNTFFSVALENGFRVYNTRTGDEYLARELGGGIGSAEMIECSKYLALVGGGKQPEFPQNKVQFWDDKGEKITMRVEFNAPVQRVRVSQTHLIVVFLNRVSIYRMAIPPPKVADYETVNNPFGLCSLGENTVIFPGIIAGQIKLFNLKTHNVSIINAHEAPLRALSLGPKGDLLATASEKGTLVRIWSFPSCTKLAELRRGIDPAAIFSMAFSPSGAKLAVTSDKSTLHIWDLVSEGAGPDPDAKNHKWGILAKIPLLPRQFSDQYSSAQAKFEMGDEPVAGPAADSLALHAGIPGVPGGRPTKGLLGWYNEETLFVVGAGKYDDAKWEKFIVGVDSAGKRAVYRDGWKRYLG